MYTTNINCTQISKDGGCLHPAVVVGFLSKRPPCIYEYPPVFKDPRIPDITACKIRIPNPKHKLPLPQKI